MFGEDHQHFPFILTLACNIKPILVYPHSSTKTKVFGDAFLVAAVHIALGSERVSQGTAWAPLFDGCMLCLLVNDDYNTPDSICLWKLHGAYNV